jgi:hypothetical protein
MRKKDDDCGKEKTSSNIGWVMNLEIHTGKTDQSYECKSQNADPPGSHP